MKKSPLKRKVGLRKMSKAKAKEHRKYLAAKVHFLGNYRSCECHAIENPCLNQATQVHHIRGRHGAYLNDQRYWLGICQTCHTWIHEHANKARNLGLLR